MATSTASTSDLTLEPQASIAFRHRILILQSKATPDRLEREFTTFAADQSSKRVF